MTRTGPIITSGQSSALLVVEFFNKERGFNLWWNSLPDRRRDELFDELSRVVCKPYNDKHRLTGREFRKRNL